MRSLTARDWAHFLGGVGAVCLGGWLAHAAGGSPAVDARILDRLGLIALATLPAAVVLSGFLEPADAGRLPQHPRRQG